MTRVSKVTCGGSLHLSCKRDQIKLRDYMDRRGGLPHLSGLLHLRGVSQVLRTDTSYHGKVIKIGLFLLIVQGAVIGSRERENA